MNNLSENNIKITEIIIDVVERELEFVGIKDNRDYIFRFYLDFYPFRNVSE